MEDAPKMPESIPKGRPVQLLESRFQLAEFSRAVYQVVPEHGVAWEQVLQPEFWAHVARRVKRYDRIEVIAEDGSYYGDLLVTDTRRGGLIVEPLFFKGLEGPAERVIDMDDYEIRYKGKHWQWTVIRKSDNHAVLRSFETAAKAQQAALGLSKAA